MVLLRTVYRPCLRHAKLLCTRTEQRTTIPNTRKIVPLNVVMASCPQFQDKLACSGYFGDEDWKFFRRMMMGSGLVTDQTVDPTMIDACMSMEKYRAARSYIKFLMKANGKVPLSILYKYLQLFYIESNELTAKDVAEMLQVYDFLRREYPVVDSNTAKLCILCLCLTDRWEESMELMEMIKIADNVALSTYSIVITCAFEHDKSDVAWQLMSCDFNKLALHNGVYMSYLEHCKRTARDKDSLLEKVERMFQYWHDHYIIPFDTAVDRYTEALESHGIKTKRIQVQSDGLCSNCFAEFKDMSIHPDEFKKLSNAMMNQGIIGKDIYLKSTPKELQRFKMFVDSTKPYDMVVDGLNVMHVLRGAHVKLFDSFVKQNQKVLVVIKPYMKKFIHKKFFKGLLHFFYADTLSNDDPYILYATMASGPHTTFLSADLMRQHKASLNDLQLQLMFERWRISRQYLIHEENMTFNISRVWPRDLFAQKLNGQWHVPSTHEDTRIINKLEFPPVKEIVCFSQQETPPMNKPSAPPTAKSKKALRNT